MGLDAGGLVTKKTYHAGYGALHLVRWLALVDCGFPEEIGGKSTLSYYPAFYVVPEGLTAKDLANMVWASNLAGHLYPNLLLHSDCEGSYTRRGAVDVQTFMTGSSVGLLQELEALKSCAAGKKHLKSHARLGEVFTMLYEMVKDEVKNGKGHIEFH
jgi:hypothetical protein